MRRSLCVLLLTGVVFLFAMSSGFPLFARLSYILILTIAGSFLWSWLNLRWLEVHVDRRTSRVHVGQQVDERITIRNTGWLAKLWLEVVDLTDLQEHDSGMTVGLPGKSFRSWRISIRALHRGMYRLGPLRITTGDPFGLFRLERYSSGTQRVLVLPAVVPLPGFSIPSADLPGDGPTRYRSQQVTPHAASVREYTPGDSVSRIHWPSTARQGRLMVKEFDLGLTSDLWVLVDLQKEIQAQDEEDSTDEVAVTAAASIARHFLNRRLPVGLVVNGESLTLLPPDRGHLQDARILETLAEAKAAGATPLAEVITKLDPWLSRYTTLVVVTSATTGPWVEALKILAHRNVRLAAVLVDSTTFGGENSPQPLLPVLAELGVLGYVVGKGDDLAEALAHPTTGKRQEVAGSAGNRRLPA